MSHAISLSRRINALRSCLPCLLICACCWMAGCRPTPLENQTDNRGAGRLSSEAEFREKMAELRIEKNKLERAIERLELEKQKSIEYLKSKGVGSLQDVGENSDLQYAVRNLQAWSDEIKTRSKDIAAYDEAISSIGAMLQDLERKRIGESVSLNEEDYFELRKIVVDLNDRLGMDQKDLLADQALDDFLKTELGPGKEDAPKQ